MAKNIAKQQEDNSEGDICYLANICELDKPEDTRVKQKVRNVFGILKTNLVESN